MSVHCFCVYHLSFVILTDRLLTFMYFLAEILPIWHKTLDNQSISINQSICSQKLQGPSKLLLKGNIFCEIPTCFVFFSWHQANKLCACFLQSDETLFVILDSGDLVHIDTCIYNAFFENIFFIPCYSLTEKLYLNNHPTK